MCQAVAFPHGSLINVWSCQMRMPSIVGMCSAASVVTISPSPGHSMTSLMMGFVIQRLSRCPTPRGQVADRPGGWVVAAREKGRGGSHLSEHFVVALLLAHRLPLLDVLLQVVLLRVGHRQLDGPAAERPSVRHGAVDAAAPELELLGAQEVRDENLCSQQ